MNYRRALTAVVLVAVATLCGCSSSKATMPGAASPPPAAPRAGNALPIRVGAADVDITPPPGVSTFGYGPDSLATEGFWTRLSCHVFVFETIAGAPHALAACELPAIGFLLQRRVAEELKGLVHPSRLMLTASHTHQGPGHFIENPAFSGILSTRLPGFDPNLVSFLARRIAGGIRDAYEHRELAKLRWSQGAVWGVSRNRAIEPFRANSPRFVPPPAPDPGLTIAEQTIDPRLDLLEIVSAQEPATPIGAVAFFAVHPTVLPAHTRLLGGDLFGVTTRLVARELWFGSPSGQRRPIAALVNTNEGDIAPAWKEGTASETVRLGEQLARGILRLAEQSKPNPWSTEIALDNRYVEVDLPNARYSGGRLCERAVIGQSSYHGPPDHHASVEGIHDEVPDYLEDPGCDTLARCQTPKAPLLGIFQPFLASKQGFAERVPLALQRLGDRWLAFVPAELTITAGQRLRRSVEASLGPMAHDRSLVVGLANAYIEYVTTREEYQLQRYEGGSNLYGENTLAFLTERFAWLAGVLRGTAPIPPHAELGVAKAFEYQEGPKRERMATPSDGPSLSALGKARKAELVCRVDVFEPPALCFQWRDGSPGQVPMQAPWIRLLDAKDRAVATCFEPLSGAAGTRCDPTFPVDDRGFDFFTWLRGSSEGLHGWTSLYRPSKAQWAKLQTEEFRLAAADVRSPPFIPGELEACRGAVLRSCLRGALDR
jgi:neutral ceramidase